MATMTTTLRPAWRLKMVLIIIAVGGLGIWGFIDASIVYPARGEKFARIVAEYEYLDGAAGPVDRRRAIRAADVSVEAPEQALRELSERQTSTGLSGMEGSRRLWLWSLSVVGRLAPEHTTFVDDGGPRDPDVRLEELTAERAGITDVPKAVHLYDIAVQWLIFGVCMTVAGWCLLLVVRTATKRYSYDTDTKTLTLPAGKSFAVDDIDDIDKRRWHKFYVTVKIREDHPTLAGREIELDLYRRALIEDWILEMERIRFPDRIEDEQDSEEGEAHEDAGEPAEEQPVE